MPAAFVMGFVSGDAGLSYGYLGGTGRAVGGCHADNVYAGREAVDSKQAGGCGGVCRAAVGGEYGYGCGGVAEGDCDGVAAFYGDFAGLDAADTRCRAFADVLYIFEEKSPVAIHIRCENIGSVRAVYGYVVGCYSEERIGVVVVFVDSEGCFSDAQR